MKTVSIFNALGYGIKSYFRYFKYILFFTIIFGLFIGFIFFIVDFKSILKILQYQGFLSFDSISELNNILGTVLSNFQSFEAMLESYKPIPLPTIFKIIKSFSAVSTLLLFIVAILIILVSGWIKFSLVKLSLKDLKNQNTKFTNILKFKFKLLDTYIGALISYGVITNSSFVFAIILVPVFSGFLNLPEARIISFAFIIVLLIAVLIFGFTIMYSYILTPFIVVDKEISVKDAFSLSKRIASGSRIKIFIFDLLLMLLGIILTLGQFLLLSLIYQHKHYLGNSYIASFLTLAIYSFISITLIFIGIFSFTYIYQVLLRNFLIKSKEQLA